MPRINVVIAGDAAKFKKAMQDVQRDMRNTASALSTIGGQMLKTVGAPVAAVGAASVMTAMKFERMEMGLKAIMGNAQDAEAELKKLTKTAQMPGVSLDQAIQGSVRLQAVGINADLARNAIQEFGNALAVSGGSAADLDGVILALTQMKGAGKILTQDLRQITTRIPMLAQVLKKQFGTDIPEEINKMGISFEEFSAKIIQGMQNEIPRATNTLENSFVNLKLAGEGLLNVIGKQLMEDLNIQGFVEGATKSIDNMAASFAKMNPFIKNSVYAIAGFTTILGGTLWIGGKIAFAISSIHGAFALLAPRIIAARNAMIAFSKSTLLFLSNPLVLAAAATLGGLVAAFEGLQRAMQMEGTIGNLSRQLFTQNETVRWMTTKYWELKEALFGAADGQKKLGEETENTADWLGRSAEEVAKWEETLAKIEKRRQEEAKRKKEAEEAMKKRQEEIKKIYGDLGKELDFLTKKQALFGGSLAPEVIKTYESAIDSLLRMGYNPMSKAIQDLKAEVDALNESLAARVVKTLDVLPTQDDNIGKRDVEGNSLAPQIGNRLTDFGSMNIAGDVPEIKDQNAALERQAELLRQLQSEFELGRQVGEQFGATLAKLATTGELSMKKLGRAAMVAAAQVVRAKLMQAVASYIADAFAKLGVLGGILAGASAGLVGGLFDAAISKIGGKAIPALAEGGMTTSAGYAMIGDNPSGKEFVIPYEKMGDFARRAMGGSNVNVTGEFRVKGTDLVLVLERQNRLTTAKRGYGINA